MRKGLVDMWMMIGVLFAILVFAMLIIFQSSANNAWTPSLVPGLLFYKVRR